jgi:hypothetical protein
MENEKKENIYLKSQYDIDINNYKKQLEEKIEEEQSKLKTIQELNNIMKNQEEENKEIKLDVIKTKERIRLQDQQLERSKDLVETMNIRQNFYKKPKMRSWPSCQKESWENGGNNNNNNNNNKQC